MNGKSVSASPALRVAAVAILAGVTAALTLLVRIPSPARGYFNLGDVVITFTALTLGPLTALFSGGLGTAAADLIGGFPQWAPISLVVHGVQGLIIGLIARLRPASLGLAIGAGVAGVLVMAGGYLAGGSILVGFGAELEELPGNLVQSAAGIVLGIPLSLAVRRAYPPVRDLPW